ncbi:hypothetical protein [Thioclava pacifica]|uniref:Secreted protein n=1 Tax=Thioclava pacifica DSM 10166 TaxID=1353537 RepID=A0A074J0M1_9RHOB|nr:hypothetical protein [Thioclava pacifica]KEO50931.1 hypothetical protein TP2_13665 [Thioclava pacifica DSM 10166]
MTKMFTASLAIAATLATALPGLAQGVQAPPNLSQEALVAWAQQADICNGTRVLDAEYTPEGMAQVTCAKGMGGNLGGGTPVAMVLVGVGLAAAAMGGGGGTNSTNGTN